LCRSCRRARFLERVTQAAYRNDLRAARLDLFSKPMHIDLDRVIADFLAPLAQMIDELFLRHEPAGSLQ
jgi:hypothetical protein